jgi:hypothetical protein
MYRQRLRVLATGLLIPLLMIFTATGSGEVFSPLVNPPDQPTRPSSSDDDLWTCGFIASSAHLCLHSTTDATPTNPTDLWPGTLRLENASRAVGSFVATHVSFYYLRAPPANSLALKLNTPVWQWAVPFTV